MNAICLHTWNFIQCFRYSQQQSQSQSNSPVKKKALPHYSGQLLRSFVLTKFTTISSISLSVLFEYFSRRCTTNFLTSQLFQNIPTRLSPSLTSTFQFIVFLYVEVVVTIYIVNMFYHWIFYSLKNNFLPFFAGLFINLIISPGCCFILMFRFSLKKPSLVSNLMSMSIGRIILFIIPVKNFVDTP